MESTGRGLFEARKIIVIILDAIQKCGISSINEEGLKRQLKKADDILTTIIDHGTEPDIETFLDDYFDSQ